MGACFHVGACVIDNAGQCGRARRILALRHPDIIFLHCFAHDVNNLVKEVLRYQFSVIAKQASSAVNYLNAASATWLVHAKAIMMRRYGETRGLDRLCEMRWKSIHDCSTSLSRVRGALESLAFDFQEHKVLGRPVFWKSLKEAEEIIAPLAEASYRLQQSDNTLADVVLSLRDIYCAFASNETYGHGLVRADERRWANCEQPLFLLGFFLHPSMRDETAGLLEAQPHVEQFLSDAVICYYRRFYGEDTGTIRDEPSEWVSLSSLGVRLSDFKNPAPSYRKYARAKFPKLSRLCTRIFSVPVHTANVERLFSELGAIHSAVRNRLEAEKSRKLHSVGKRVREDDGVVPGSKKRKKIRGTAELVVKHGATTPVAPLQDDEDDEDDDDPSLTCLVDSFVFIQTTLEAIYKDEDLTAAFVRDAGVGVEYNPLEKIPEPELHDWPTYNQTNFPQEHQIKGFRSWSITLAELFPLSMRSPPTSPVTDV
jgi:hypothetical protein